MQGSTNGGDSKLHSRYLPWEGDAEQQGAAGRDPEGHGTRGENRVDSAACVGEDGTRVYVL
jgi:hypothetical protein